MTIHHHQQQQQKQVTKQKLLRPEHVLRKKSHCSAHKNWFCSNGFETGELKMTLTYNVNEWLGEFMYFTKNICFAFCHSAKREEKKNTLFPSFFWFALFLFFLSIFCVCVLCSVFSFRFLLFIYYNISLSFFLVILRLSTLKTSKWKDHHNVWFHQFGWFEWINCVGVLDD